jgi:hypothetical protein
MLIFILNGQIISEKILSKEDNKAIPFAQIGIENSDIGKMTDKNGCFTFDVSAVEKSANIIVEVPGYEIYKISLANFTHQNRNFIFLNEKIKKIEEIKIEPKKYEDKTGEINQKE